MIQVDFFPNQAHCYAFGGFEYQMHDAVIAARSQGIDVRLLDSWQRVQPAAIAHHWGLGFAHFDNIRWARRAGQKIVCTALFDHYETFAARLRNFAGSWLGETRITRDCVRLIDALIVVNDIQLEVAIRFFGASRSRVHVVPNIVDESFFKATAFAHNQHYWICPGSICRRKRQVIAAKAALEAGTRLLIIGDPLPGEEDYGRELHNLLAGQSLVEWRRSMARSDREYVKLMAESRGLLFPSVSEQQPIVILEAMVLGKPVLLAEVPYARQYEYRTAILLPADNISAFACSLKEANLGIQIAARERYSITAVGLAYRSIYEKILL